MEPKWSENDINYLEKIRYDMAAEDYLERNLGDYEEFLTEHGIEDSIDQRLQWLEEQENYLDFRYEFENSDEWFIKD